MSSNPRPAAASAPAASSGGSASGSQNAGKSNRKRNGRGGGRGGGGNSGGGGGGGSSSKKEKKKPSDDTNQKNKAPNANPGQGNPSTTGTGTGDKKKRNRRRTKKNVEGDAKPQGKGQGQGGSGGGHNRNKNKSKGPKKEKTKAPTEEELRIIAEKKAEEERLAAIQKIAEQKAKAAAELERQTKELEEIMRDKLSQLNEFVDKSLQHRTLREENSSEQLLKTQSAFRDSKKSLKSDLKKCTAFCKKIKSAPSFDDIVVKSMLKDISTLNLTRYLEEIANAFLESKLKVVDVYGVVQVCTALHQRYSDFIMDILLPSMIRSFKSKDTVDAKQRRIFLRIMTELLICGVLPETKPVMKIVVDASGAPKADSGGEKYVVTDPNMLISFAKAAGHELIGVYPKGILEDVDYITREQKRIQQINSHNILNDEGDGEVTDDNESEGRKATPIMLSAAVMADVDVCIRRLETVKDDRAVSEEVCDKFRKHLAGAYRYLSTSLVSTHKKLSKMEKRCEQDRLLAGSISEQREKALLDARKLLESLKKSVEALAEVLNESMPELVEEEDESRIEAATGLEVYKGDDIDTKLGPFDDEETRAFYCDIPDLLTTIPPALLGYSPEDIEKMQEANLKKYGNEDNDAELEETDIDGVDGNTNEKDFEENESNNDDEDAEEANTENSEENKETPHYKLMVLIEQELPECNRRDKTDELAEKFCTNHGATKKSRTRLKQALFLVPRSRLDLIPYYSRLAAIFDRVFPDIASQLVTELENQFHGLTRWKKQQSIENRIRNAKFIGELTKFRVAPPIVALRSLRRCLDDFSGYNVDIACCLLESCGRFLHKTRHTSAKLALLMDTMSRIRKAKHFEERAVEMMKSAFYMVQPPQQKVKRNVKILSPIEAYLKDLLLVRLDKSSVSFASKQILRLSWGDSSIDYGSLIVKYMLKACRKGRYNSIAAVASLVFLLKKPKPELLARLIDGILEEFCYIMEHPNIRDQQRAIIYAKLLGELHSQSLVSSQAVFDQLYTLVNFDHHIPDSLREASIKPAEETISSDLKSPLGISGAIAEDEEMEDDSSNEDERGKEKSDKPQAPVAVSVHSIYDPRVPSDLDTPFSVFRIKLICTLLDNCISSLVTASNFSKLENFLSAFQRYVFIKSTLPTDIEFSLLDTFDLIESNLRVVKKDNKRMALTVRHKTWLEAHNAVIAAEEFEALNQKKARTRLLAQAGIVSASSLDDGIDDTFEDQELLDDGSVDDLSVNSMGDDKSIDNSDGSVSEDELSDDNDDDTESDEETDEDDDEEMDDDDAAAEELEIAAHELHMRKLEDEAFERELRMLTMEAVEKGKHSARTMTSAKVSDTMPSAAQFTYGRSKKADPSTEHEATGNGIFALSGAGGMQFQLIKRGHKGRAHTKNIIVPSDTNLAKVAARSDSEAVRERELLKTRVLQYEADSAELSYSGDVYMDQGHLPEVRNRTLRMEEIDRQFGKRSYGGRSSYRGRGRGGGGRGLKRF